MAKKNVAVVPAYAGIGSRETPTDVQMLMARFAIKAAGKNYLLRSGGAGGADLAFERGCDSVGGRKAIYLPWKGFGAPRSPQGTFTGVCDRALAMAEQFHPNWAACSQGARALHARNCYQVLGDTLDEPVKFVICWTVNGLGGGGTGQALRIAKAHDIPIYDLGNADMRAFIEKELA